MFSRDLGQYIAWKTQNVLLTDVLDSKWSLCKKGFLSFILEGLEKGFIVVCERSHLRRGGRLSHISYNSYHYLCHIWWITVCYKNRSVHIAMAVVKHVSKVKIGNSAFPYIDVWFLLEVNKDTNVNAYVELHECLGCFIVFDILTISMDVFITLYPPCVHQLF